MGEIHLKNTSNNTKNKYYDPLINGPFNEIDAGGGGDCLFKSLSYALYGNPKDHFKVRQRICKAPIPEELKPFYIEKERKKMCNLTIWGTHLEVMIAAKIYNRPIIVYKSGHTTGIGSLCEGYAWIDDIKNNIAFKGVRKYLIGDKYKSSAKRIYCIYLPDNDTDKEPLILYNIGQVHYRVLKPKISRRSPMNRKKSKKVSINSRKTSRKIKKASRKTSRKSKKVSRKSKKVSRKSKKTSRKSKKTSRKSKKASRKTSRKSKKASRKTSRKSKKASRKTSRKSKKSKKY
jgi:hypothetical protein